MSGGDGNPAFDAAPDLTEAAPPQAAHPAGHGDGDGDGDGDSDFGGAEARERAQARAADEEDSQHVDGPSSCFLALLPTAEHLGVARYDEEECMLEVMHLPADVDGEAAGMLFVQLRPHVIVAPAKHSEKAFLERLDTFKKKGAEIIYLPPKEFSYANGFHRLTAIASEVNCALLAALELPRHFAPWKLFSLAFEPELYD